MASFTRKFLSALGVESDKVDEIITAHVEVVDALKDERDKYKKDAETLASVEKELEELKAHADEDNPYEAKYNALKEEYENYKAEQAEAETKRQKKSAYRDLLKEAGVSEKRIDTVLKVTNLDEVELTKEGKIKDADKFAETIKEEWADFIVVRDEKGAKTTKPPASTHGDTFKDMSLDEKMAYANANPTDPAVKEWLGK